MTAKKTTTAKAKQQSITPRTSKTLLSLIIEEQNLLSKQKLIEELLKDQVISVNPFTYGADSYKLSHKDFEISGVKEIYSNFTPRFAKYLAELLGDAFDGKYVVFGIQWMLLRLHMMLKKGFFERNKEEVLEEMAEVLTPYIGMANFEHFGKLHDLGYLPVKIKTLDEGTVLNVGTPFLTIRNTLPEFEWLPNFLETIISTDLWKQLTVATIARAFKRISIDFAMKTHGSTDGIEFQNHDFHVRGASGWENASIVGSAFLASSCGTDNTASLWNAKNFYFTTNDQGLLAGSVSAGEHSVTTSGILTTQERWNTANPDNQIDLLDAERIYTRSVLTEKFPTGIVAGVGDSFDYWGFVSDIVPSLKTEILARDGKFVVRGDSGNPVDVITGIQGVNIKDAIARKFNDLETGNTFAVDGQLYKVVAEYKTDQVNENNYLPFFALENGGFIRKWDIEAETVKYEHNQGVLQDTINQLEKAQTDENTDSNQSLIDELEILIKNNTEFFNGKHVVICAEEKGTIESLWEVFGGTETATGYKLLDSHIGHIYGDGITVQRSQEILSRLEAKGFASLNVVFGVGSYSLNLVSRDHLGMAIKATNTIVDVNGVDVDKPIYKDPKTDTSKKSARGLIQVFKDEDDVITFKDMATREEEEQGLLTVAYENGEFKKFTNLFEIRQRIWG